MDKLNEKMIDIPNPYPVKMEEIIDLVERSTRLIHTTTDSKTIQLYIYSTGRDRPDYLAEVEITSAGYILHDDDGFYYQGSTFKEFQNDLREVVFHFDAVVFKRLGENVINKEQFFNKIINESSLKEYFFYAPPHHEEDEDNTIIGYIAAVRDYQTQKTKYVDDEGKVCNSKSQAKVFDTKGKADNYSYEHCPEGWTHFVVALKKSDILNESDDNYKAKRLKELTQNEFNRLARRRDEFRTQTAISPAEKNNLYADIKDFEEEFRDLQDTAERLPDSYIDQVCDTASYPFEVAIDEVKDVEDWCSEAEEFLKDDINNWGIVKEANLSKKRLKETFDSTKAALFNYLLESIDDFPKNTRAMYRFARRRHNDTGAIRKVSKEPYWVHPEGVAKIVMEHGGSDIEIKAAMAHDVLEDTGDTFEDIAEKFGEDVASIVKEVTNDNDEIAKIGKERYISEELCRLSPEALTVKLADMLYNMKDSPSEKNYERMRKNVAFLMMNRHLNGKHLELAREIMEV